MIKRSSISVATLLLTVASFTPPNGVRGQELLKQLEEKLRLKNPSGEPKTTDKVTKPEADKAEVDENPFESEGELLPVPKPTPDKKESTTRKSPSVQPVEHPNPFGTVPSATNRIQPKPKPTNNSTPAPPRAQLPFGPTTSRSVPAPSITSPAPSASSPSIAPPTLSGLDPAEVESNSGGGYLGMTLEPTQGGGFGLSVVEVTPQSPAWKGGFKVGDRVIGVAGQAVATIDQFAKEIEKYPPGSAVKFLVQRKGRSTNLVAVPQDRTLAGQIQGSVPGTAIPLNPPAMSDDPIGFLGVSVADLSDAFRRQFGIAAYRGASITEVAKGSPAAVVGIRPGDCIVEVDGKVVQSAATLVDSVRSTSPGKSMTISFYRGRQLNTVAVEAANGSIATASGYEPVTRSNAVSPEMLTPEYVTSLQGEVARLQQELLQTQSRLRDVEAKNQNGDRNLR